MTNFKILTEEQIASELHHLPEWKVVDGKLKAEFVFRDFKQAVAFINMVALQSEQVNHHPEWTNTYNKVSFAFATHDADDKITDLDTKMAIAISGFSTLFLGQ